MLICDDYFFEKTQGARKAIDEFFSDNVPIVFDYQALLIK